MSHGKVVFRGGYGLNYNQQQIATANNYDGNPPGTNYLSGSSKNPSEINPNILYAVSSSPTDIAGYPANPTAMIRSIRRSAHGGRRQSQWLPRNCPPSTRIIIRSIWRWTWDTRSLPTLDTKAAPATTRSTTTTPTALADIHGFR